MTRRSAERWAGGALLLATAFAHAARAGEADGAASEGALLLAVSINGQEVAEPAVLLQTAAGFLAEESAVRAWRLTAPQAAQVVRQGRRYVALSAVPGLEIRLDGARQVLRIRAPPEAFEATALDGSDPASGAVGRVSVPAAFASYALSAEAGSDSGSVTAFIQAGASGAWGLITSTQAFSRGGVTASAVRLETVYSREAPDRLRRLTLGDGLTRGADWAQPVRFAGVRYGSAFDLQPRLITFPTPVFVGRTALPSDVELYVNDVLQFQGKVDPGPFSLARAPLTTGAGEVSLQVRDALGVDHAVTSPYYVSPDLLKAGLSEVSYELGAERRAFGLESFAYGPPFAAFSLRRGLASGPTLETRVEAGARVQDAGLGAQWVLSSLGEVSLAASASHSGAGVGGLLRAGFSRISPRWSVSAVYQQSTPAYRQVGSGGPFEDAPVRGQFQAAAGVAFGRMGNLSAAFTQLKLGAAPSRRVVSLTYSVRALGRAFVSVFALHSRSGSERSETRAGISITAAFGRGGSALLQIAGGEHAAEVRTTPPSEGGWGWRVAESGGAREAVEADATYRAQAGEATVQARRDGGGTDVRLLVSGAAVLVADRLAATRQLSDGFAVVETPGVGGVQVSVENRPVARTDRRGVAVVTDLRPYDLNRIAVNPGDLPLDAALASDTMIVSPTRLGGVRARFAVALEHPATLILHDADGRALAPGSQARIDGGAALHVGFDGELFVPALRQGSVVVVQEAGGLCRALGPTAPAAMLIPRIGPLVCTRIAP